MSELCFHCLSACVFDFAGPVFRRRLEILVLAFFEFANPIFDVVEVLAVLLFDGFLLLESFSEFLNLPVGVC